MLKLKLKNLQKKNLDEKSLAFDYFVEIDNDYLYHGTGYLISHINTLRVVNKYYKKYGNPNLVDLKNGILGQIERQLKLNQIIDE